MIRRVLPDKKWFTVSEVAEALGVTIPTAYRWVRENRIAAEDMAAENHRRPTYRISRDSLQAASRQIKEGLMPSA